MPSFHRSALDYCRWLTESSRSNFVPALRLLPREKREAMEAVYAFCRVVDDVVDHGSGSFVPESQTACTKVPDPFSQKRELDLWRQELAACQGGFPAHPVALALQPVISRYRIPLEHFESLVEGVEMDLTRRRYARFEDLAVYCRHVASMVGLISIRIFGCRHPASEQYAESLGIALQLTNILRDLKPDWERGRVYLPSEEMARFGLSEEDLAQGRRSEPFRKLMAFQCERARSFFQQARSALKESGEGRILLPARIMGGVYEHLLGRIEQLQYDVFSHRVSVPARRQIWIAAGCLLK